MLLGVFGLFLAEPTGTNHGVNQMKDNSDTASEETDDEKRGTLDRVLNVVLELLGMI